MSLFKKIKNSGFWQTTEVIFSVITQFAYLAIMARILSKSDFGLMAIANSFVVLGGIFAESGMGAALIQRKNITLKHYNAALQGGILFGLGLFVCFLFIAQPISVFFENSQIENLIKVIAINFLIFSISAVFIGILKKEFRFKEKALVKIFAVCVSYTIGIICGINGLGVWSLVIANLLLAILETIGYILFSSFKLLRGIYLREWKELFSFGFGIMLLRISNYLGSNGITLALGKVFSPSLLGVFERTYTIKTLPSRYLGDILDTVMFPVMSEIQDKDEILFRIYQTSLGVVNTVLMPISLYLIFFGKEVVQILLGDSWKEAVIPLQIMFFVLPFSSSGRMADSVIRAKGLIYRNVFRKFLYVIVLLCSTVYGGLKFGIIGSAIGVTISYLFNYILMLFLVKSIFKKSIIEIFLSPLLAGLKLTMILLIFLVMATTIFNFWDTVNILYFVSFSCILMSIILLLIWKKSSFFGKYINDLLVRLKADHKIKVG